MKSSNGWLSALFSLIFVATPALVMFYFLLPDWADKQLLSTGSMWAVMFGFMTYSLVLNFVLIYFEILPIDSVNFNLPLTVVLSVLFISFGIDLWIRALLVIVCVIGALPVNIYVSKYKEKKLKQLKQSKK